MKRLLTFMLLTLMLTLFASPASADVFLNGEELEVDVNEVTFAAVYLYGEPSQYWSTIDNDDNNDGVVVYKHTTKKRSKARDAWRHALSEYNQIEQANGGLGLTFINANKTRKPVELYVMGVLENGHRSCLPEYGGIMEWWTNGPDYTYLCESMRPYSLRYWMVVTDHEIGHGVCFLHRPCEYVLVSIMTSPCFTQRFHIGPADKETYVDKYGNGGLITFL